MDMPKQNYYQYFKSLKVIDKFTVGGVFVLPVLFLTKLMFRGGSCDIKKDMSDQVIVITGGNNGLGRETALQLAKQKGKLVLACRNLKKCQQEKFEIIGLSDNKNIECIQLDLTDFQSIHKFVETFKKKYQKLDILINNAGVMGFPKKQFTKDNLELQMGTNYFGHFLLTNLLLDYLQKSKQARVINLSSGAHYRNQLSLDNLNSEKYYQGFQTYANSKMANILFTSEFQKRFGSDNLKAVSVHPGAINTDLLNNMHPASKYLFKITYPISFFFMKTVKQGIQTTLQVAQQEFNTLQGGGYYSDCKPKKPHKLAEDQIFAKNLWDMSEKIVKL